MRIKKRKENRFRQGAKKKITLVSRGFFFFEIFRKKKHPRQGDEKKNPLPLSDGKKKNNNNNNNNNKSPMTELPTPRKFNGASLKLVLKAFLEHRLP